MIEVKDKDGTLRLSVPVTDKCVYHKTLMEEEYVLLGFSSDAIVDFAKGDYIDTEFGRFYIVSFDKPSAGSDGSYQYEQKFHPAWERLRYRLVFYDRQRGSEKAWKMTQAPGYFLDVVCGNIEDAGLGEYTFEVDADLEEMKLVEFDGTNILDALSKIAEAWDTDWWITDNVIHLGKCESGTPVDLESNVHISPPQKDQGQDTNYCTRLYAFGSTRNLPKNYRKDSGEGTVIEGVVETRLKLPEGIPYIDAWEGMAEEDIVEGVMIFDEVYPRRTGTISSISLKEYTDEETDENGDTTYETWNAVRFRDSGITFSEEYILPGEDLRIEFQSGKLMGMDFAVKFNPDGLSEKVGENWNTQAQVFEIIRNEDYGVALPADDFRPAAGDEYILYGFNIKLVSSQYLPAAEQELLQVATKALAEASQDKSVYTCDTDPVRCAGYTDNGSGGLVYSPSDEIDLEMGQSVRLKDARFFGDGFRLSRVRGFEKHLDNKFRATYTIGESSVYSRSESLSEQVEQLAYQSKVINTTYGSPIYLIKRYDTTTPTDANAYSSKRSLYEFLSRQREDTALGRISFAQGARMLSSLQFGESFASGMAGIGGRVDKDGNGELESLILRSWLEVPEIRFNRAEVVLGDQWRAPGGGIVESVTPDTDAQGNTLPTGTVTLKLEEGEIGAVAQDDICKGYFHDFGTPSNNATADTDDSRGNTQFSGFCTVFFRITSVSSSGGGTNNVLRYSLRPQDARWKHSFHPFEAMHFVAYGNFNDSARQKSAYATRTYTRFLAGVNTWEFAAANIAMQFGDLSNLSVFGMDMAGYSAYLQNVYYSGYLDHVKVDAPHEVEVQTDTGDFFIPSSGTLTLTARVKKAWHTLEASEITSWAVTRDTGDAASDAAWNAAHASSFAGSVTLLPSDVGATALNASALFTLTAQGTDDEGEAWSASRTVAVRVEQVYPYELAIDTGGFSDIAWGETITATCSVTRGGADCTAQVAGWSVSRNSGDSAADSVWNAAHTSFAGVLQIAYTSAQDDIARTDGLSTVFTFTAVLSDGSSHTGTLSI